MGKTIDMTGQKFGRLSVVKQDLVKTGKNAYWECRCDCGQIVSVSRPNLINSHSLSCGCLRKEKISERSLFDLKGLHFGKLKVLERDMGHIHAGKAVYWKCKCECGSYTSVRSIHLRLGNTISCGCIKSKGEEIISQLLTQNRVPFLKQSPVLINGQTYYFDFAILDNDSQIYYYVEYDGEQHFHCRDTGWNTKENLILTQKRDALKNQYCIDNDLCLIRIKYTENITLDKLLFL